MANQIFHVLIGTAVISAAAQFSIDINLGELSIPITGQTLAIITWSMMVPRSTAVLGVAFYLLIGGLGLPVFADASSGWDKLVGPTSGYLWSFLIIAMGMPNKSSLSFSHIWILQIVATAFILMGGYIVLSFFTERAYELGVRPFIIAGLLKSLLGAVIVYFWNKSVRQR